MENIFIKKICFRVRKIKKCPEGWVLASARGNKETDEDRVVFISNKYYTGKIPPFFKWPWQKLYLEFEQVDGFMLSAKINNKTLFTVASENLPPKIKVKLEKGEKTEIQSKIEEYSKLRKEKQPLEYPNAGSTFKRTEGKITAKMIDECGLKGYNVGDAEISTKHAGFVINKGKATASDVLKLVEHVKNKVKEKFNVDIELEILILGEEK